MPFTLFHMGPGLVLKALLHSSFSLMVFGWSQIIMDIQPLAVLLTGKGHLHGLTHTFIGALLLGLLAGFSGKFLAEFGLGLLKIPLVPHGKILWRTSLLSAQIGSWSHVLLDALIYNDMAPLFPFLPDNPFYNCIPSLSYSSMEMFCLYAGLAGGLFYGLGLLLQRKV